MRRLIGIVVVVTGCARDPVDTCPNIVAGDLVVTEVRSDDDETNGSWIELFNASGGTLELEGARIRFRRKDGSSEIPVLIRRPLSVAADDYVVLGRYLDGMQPAHVDYGFGEDFEETWLGAAAIDLEACGERIDLAQYDALPDEGTYSLGTPPDATTNDLPTSWCFDATPAGTPGAANTACP